MARSLRIAAIEPYAALSHRLFLEGLRRSSRHQIEVLALPARAWKWRMRTAAIHFARELEERGPWDLLFASDYLNLAELRALLPPGMRDVPAVLYFHENQLTYPLQGTEGRDHHFALVHLYSMLCAREALFNSSFHRRSFLDALAALLRHVPDVEMGGALARIERRSGVLPLGTDLPAGVPRCSAGEPPIVLWNHRWEYDKDPEALLEACAGLDRRGADYRLRILGQRFRSVPLALERLRALLGERLVEDGFLEDRAAYAGALAGSHVVVSTARHEFFGLGTLEALRSGLLPVLPDDLSYPELLPPAAHASFLYAREEGLVDALESALETARSGAGMEEREALIRHTERFTWAVLAPLYDARFERAPNDPVPGA